jgi:hypothetical protein
VLTTGELATVPAGTSEDSRAAQAPGPQPNTPIPAPRRGSRFAPPGLMKMGWVPRVRGLSPPANVRHPAGVRWGLPECAFAVERLSPEDSNPLTGWAPDRCGRLENRKIEPVR